MANNRAIHSSSGTIFVIDNSLGSRLLPGAYLIPSVAIIPPPSIVVGQTLTATPGTWTHNPTSYTYQWYRN